MTMTKIDFDVPRAKEVTAWDAPALGAASLAVTSNSLLAPLRRSLRQGTTAVRAYYDDRPAWHHLFLTALVLFYVGGGAMFWLHAVYRGEKGPPIAPASHWMLDSTLGLVTLTPALFLLLPLARSLSGGRRQAEPFVLGGLFALLTTPGPVFHNLIAGEGTPLARLAASILGIDPDVAAKAPPAAHHVLSEPALQLAVGLPVYILLATLAYRALVWRGAPRPGAVARALLGAAPR